VVEDRPEGKDAIWTPIGSAWPHKDGKGFNLQLAALPATGGRIVLRQLMKEETTEEEQPENAEAEKPLSGRPLIARAGPGEPELQLAEQFLRSSVRRISSAMKRKPRAASGAPSKS
jgi:hypothetical protein